MEATSQREQIPDTVLMYASVFIYESSSVRRKIKGYTPSAQVV